MALSETSICNSALIKLGAGRIISIDDSNERARLCKEQYEKVRDELLYAHPWNFAIERASIAQLATEPISEWTYQFQLPSDCLRVLDTDIPGTQEWKVEGDKLMCDYSTVIIKYVKKVTETAKYSPAFSEALATLLAAELAYSITQSTTLQSNLVSLAEKKIREARSFDGQESAGDRVYADGWLNSRY